MIYIKNYIGGSLCEPIDGSYFDNYEPATGQVYAQIPESSEKDVEQAVAAAEKAFPHWSTLSGLQRSKYLRRISQRIEERLEELALAESRDNGKPLKLAKTVDIPRAIDNFHFFATAAEHVSSESHYMENTAINYTLRRPIGIVGCISPWNLPLYLFTWKIAPALAAGNCVVAKPSEVTPFTAYLLSEICVECALPPGVLNIVHGHGNISGQAIVAHKKVKAISFTGGTTTGKYIAATAAPMFKKISLELGGKNPNIIFEDCDFDAMLKTTIHSSFANQGQICLCGSRIFIQRTIYEKFKTAFVNEVQKMRIGNPRTDVQVGAVVSKSHQEKIISYIQLAKEEGGNVLCGGTVYTPDEETLKNGYYVLPTVIENLPYTCRTNQEEIFGPLVTLTPFDTEEEVLEMANSTEYGLAATIWTQNLQRAHRVAEKVESGIVWINCWLLRDLRTPFGGMKSSGVGREGGWEAMRFFTEAKNVCVRY